MNHDIWFDKLFLSIWDEIKSAVEKGTPLKYPTAYATIKLMKEHGDLDFFDNKLTDATESLADLMLLSFREMMLEVDMLKQEGEFSWANVKGTSVGHQLRIKPLGFHAIMTGGNGGDVVNATGRSHGPSQRIIIEMDPEGVRAWGHYPGGQSGNPGSKYYDNMVMSWATGQYYDLLFMHKPDASHSRIIFSQTLSNN